MSELTTKSKILETRRSFEPGIHLLELNKKLLLPSSKTLRLLLEKSIPICAHVQLRPGKKNSSWIWVIVPRARLEVIAYGNYDVLMPNVAFFTGSPDDHPNYLYLRDRLSTFCGQEVDLGLGFQISKFDSLWISRDSIELAMGTHKEETKSIPKKRFPEIIDGQHGKVQFRGKDYQLTSNQIKILEYMIKKNAEPSSNLKCIIHETDIFSGAKISSKNKRLMDAFRSRTAAFKEFFQSEGRRLYSLSSI